MWVPGRSHSPWAAEGYPSKPAGRVRPAGLAILLGLALLATPPACSPAVPPSRSPGDWLVLSLPADPESLNFVLAGDRSSQRVGRLVADGLVDHDQHLEIVPRLASSWEVSPDRKTITFHLREGVRWHDGAPFTSDDVLFTYARIVDPASGALSKRNQFQEVQNVKAVDPLTVRVTYERPYAAALLAWETPVLPKHIYENDDFLTSPFNRSPLGTGPYRFRSWKTAQEIVLDVNEDYWGDPPSIRRVIFKIIPSRSTQYQALLAGELDLAILREEQWMTLLEGEKPDHIRLLRYPTLQLAYLAWNGDGTHPAFKDPRVRRALTLLTDRQAFLDKVLLGFGEVAASVFHSSTTAYDPALPPLPHDPEEAGRLLDEAGWKLSPDGTARVKDGEEFRFRLITTSGIEWQEKFSVFLQESLGRAGIRMDIRKMDHTALVANLRKGRFQAALSMWGLDIDPDPFPILHSSQIRSGINYAAYRDSEVDRLLEEGRRELDPPSRSRIYHEVGRRAARDQPYTLLFFPTAPLAIDSRFENVEISPMGIFNWYPAVLDWYVPAGRQKYHSSGGVGSPLPPVSAPHR